MLTRLAEYGEVCLDAAGFTSTQAVKNACQLDYVDAFSFYIGNTYGVAKDQFQIAFDHGKKVSPNREGNSHEAFTWSSGPVREIDQTRLILDKFGIDWRNVPTIDSAVDWNPLSSEIARCDDWWRQSVDHARTVGFWGGYYGATAYGKRLKAFDWWPEEFPTWTWGGSGTIPGTAMKQYAGYPSGNNYSSIGVTVDESQVRAGLWMVSSFETGPPPATQGVDMSVPMLMVNSEPYPPFEPARSLGYVPPDGQMWPVGWIWFERMPSEVGGGKRWQTGGEEFQAIYDYYIANGMKAATRTTGQLQGIPDYKPPPAAAGPKGDPGPSPKSAVFTY
jgi:hypothetical protein